MIFYIKGKIGERKKRMFGENIYLEEISFKIIIIIVIINGLNLLIKDRISVWILILSNMLCIRNIIK